ncbi:Tacyl-phosphate glycerol 3-phosphate acyltransferase [Gaiella occulta]|uniref:Glycerol-3-phosphate acyltransferase n=1 Tax=Gaiella occulta TaxID=1002870 RepID=A0A7M2Z2U8_9ACTN|nr:glycerol-3-phosphate 1-O-acyltransferase PlsY [Gaiella occulta]RDI76183.1 Tacyl-phosphate glycerol 3-phosphate acyltransferase [Gaiella occulta]
MVTDAVIVVVGYLVGSIPFGVVVVRLARGEDIRAHGSGNIGASNVWRTYGRSLGIPVALLDVVKGLVPALVGLEVGGEWVGVLAGAAAMAGHARPVWLRFAKGGKMVATAGGVSFALAPVAAALCLLVWVATFALFRYASLASLVTAVALPALSLLLGEPWPTVALALAACAGVIVLHRENIRRLLDGSESRFSRSRRPTASA